MVVRVLHDSKQLSLKTLLTSERKWWPWKISKKMESILSKRQYKSVNINYYEKVR